MKRVLTLRNIMEAKVEVFPFTGEWESAFGHPQRDGAWYIFGNSGHGKTSFIMQLIKELAAYGRVLFVSLEEGEVSSALQKTIARLGMLTVNDKVGVINESREDLEKRLKMRRSADIVIIDSLEYTDFRDIREVVRFTRQFPGKLFVFIDQADGKKPASKLGHDVLHFANQKIWVEGYRAISRGRSFGELGYYTIWEKGAQEYWDYK